MMRKLETYGTVRFGSKKREHTVLYDMEGCQVITEYDENYNYLFIEPLENKPNYVKTFVFYDYNGISWEPIQEIDRNNDYVIYLVRQDYD